MEFEFKIEKECGVISEKSNGWKKELNLVSYNGREPKYDIREWDCEHEKMSKGVTLNREEARELYKILGNTLGCGSIHAPSGMDMDAIIDIAKDNNR